MFAWIRSNWAVRCVALLMACSAVACSYLALLQLKRAGISIPQPGILAIALGVAVALVAGLFRSSIESILPRVGQVRVTAAKAIALGLVIRLGWWWATLPTVQVSDGASYLQLAENLANGEAYFLDGYAFWPPGTPLIYALFMLPLGQQSWLPLVINLISFAIGCVAMLGLTRTLKLPDACARVAILLLAVWPELVFASAMVSKETLLLGLLPACFWFLLRPGMWFQLVAGLLSGLVALIQPSLLLLPLLYGIVLLYVGHEPKHILRLIVVVTGGMCLVVAPWSYRNFLIFGEPVIVSTNAGYVFHAGNQAAMVESPETVGGFITPPAPQERFKDDLEASRWHQAQALRFIRENPSDFVYLVRNRFIVTMGDDSDSAYRSLRLSEKASGWGYVFFKGICNGFWLLLTTVLAFQCWRYQVRRDSGQSNVLLVLAASATLYLLAIHGLAEGGARHHMGWAWIYGLLVPVLALVPPASE